MERVSRLVKPIELASSKSGRWHLYDSGRFGCSRIGRMPVISGYLVVESGDRFTVGEFCRHCFPVGFVSSAFPLVEGGER